MRVIKFIILVAVLGLCFLPVSCVVENDAKTDEKIIFVYCYWDSVNNVFVYEDIVDRDDFYFSPDHDKRNDFFIVKSSNDEPVSLKITTRAGVLIFSIEAKLCVWDGCSLSGQPMTNGVYFYTAELRGTSPKVSKSGFVYLYRGKK